MRRLIFASLALVFAACSHVAYHDDSCRPTWNYEQQDEWPDACKDGPDRSPINISTTTSAGAPQVDIQYTSFFPQMYNNERGVKLYANNGGGSVRVTYANGQSKVFTLQELHFHVPGEHTFDGPLPRRAPMELHLVNQDAAGNAKVVVAILFDDTTTAVNPGLSEIIPILPTQTCRYITSSTRINPMKLLPDPTEYRSYYYNGALTTPPCGGGLEFFVFVSRAMTNPTQIQGIARVTPGPNAKTIGVRELPGIPVVPVVRPR